MNGKNAFMGWVSKLGLLIIVIITVLIILLTNDLNFFSQSSQYSITKKSCEYNEGTILEGDDPSCNPRNCDELNCTDEEQTRWNNLKKGFEETQCFEDVENCESAFEEKMHKMVVEGEVGSDTQDLGDPAEYSLSDSQFNEKIDSIDLNVGGFEDKVREASQDLELNYNAIAALVKKEIGQDISSFNPSSQNSNVRFECHIYNGKRNGEEITTDYCSDAREDGWFSSDKEVKCTINSGEVFSRNAEETGREAFEQAYEENSDLAICSSSFGAFQLMGFNANSLGFTGDNKYEKFKEEISTSEGQIKLFFRYLHNEDLLGEFQKENPNWEIIALRYNGGAFEQNNYAQDIASNYEDLTRSS